MSREKLRDLGIDLPLFPTTSVGSFPKPDYLMKARTEFARKKIDRAELENSKSRRRSSGFAPRTSWALTCW